MAIVTPAKFNGMDAFYLKMLRLLVKDLPETWAGFDTASADIENTKAFVHKIKGVAGNLDLTELYESAVAFEASLRAGEPAAELYVAFIKACEDIKKEVPMDG